MIERLKRHIRLLTSNKLRFASLLIILVWLCFSLLDPLLTGDPGFYPYAYNDLNPSERLLPPMSQGESGIHLLGTDNLGRDVAAGMIHGSRVAFIVSFMTIILALISGLSIGLLIGYYGNKGLKKNILQQFFAVITFILTFYYLVSAVQDGFRFIDISLLLLVLFAGSALMKILGKLPMRKIGVPLDFVIQRVFELRESIPGLFVILSIVAIVTSPSIITIALIMTLLIWITFARHARAETLAIKEEDYVKSAKSTGMSDIRILLNHILPNALPPILVIVAFSFSSVILLESTLSFLGIGIPVEEISWGKILTEARKHPKAWWLAVFPGSAIFLLLFSFNNLGDYFSQYQRKSK